VNVRAWAGSSDLCPLFSAHNTASGLWACALECVARSSHGATWAMGDTTRPIVTKGIFGATYRSVGPEFRSRPKGDHVIYDVSKMSLLEGVHVIIDTK
jgi:hypothetical protein